LIRRRLLERHGHFAGEAILDDQFATLQEPTDAIVVEVDQPPDKIVEEVLGKIHLQETSPVVDDRALLRKLRWGLLPFLFLLYVVAYLDRINVGFAALQMKDQLGFSDEVYGLGAGIFFAGYFLFQVPSNLALAHVGARRWISALMVLWGIISAAMLFIHSPHSFYALRFSLGAAEAGFFPGVIYYLRSWFPPAARAGVVALFMTAGPISGVIGGPISGILLDLNRRGGLAGWQWMFLIEAIPAMVLGIFAYIYLRDRPEDASWLAPGEKLWLRDNLRDQTTANKRPPSRGSFGWLANPMIWALGLVYFCLNTCTYGVTLWLPSAFKSFTNLSNVLLGFLSAVPYLAAAIIMILVGTHSDRTLERRWHLALSAFLGAGALVTASYSGVAALSIAAFSIALAASSSMTGPFWALASGTVSEAAAASGIAVINAIGNLGSGFGPYWIGYLRTVTGGFRAGLLSVALLMTLAGVVVLLLRLSSAVNSKSALA
jgi:MFS transporter, ACS family, tartrate transporter